MVVAIAAVAGVLEMEERHDAAAEELRLAGRLQLSAPDEPWQILTSTEASWDAPVEMDMRVRVRNDGPQDVTVTNAGAGAFVMVHAPVLLPAQTTVELHLQQKVQCGPESPAPSGARRADGAAPGPLQITARTSRGIRTITLARPPYYSEYAAEVCAYLRTKPPTVN